MYTMAIHLGLGAEELCALNLGDVSPDGRWVYPTANFLKSEEHDPVRITDDLQRVVGKYLQTRCACIHMRLPLKTYLDSQGVRRCHACHDDVNTDACPLFIGRQGRRISAKRIRNEFAENRRKAGLDEALHFQSLRLTSQRIPKLDSSVHEGGNRQGGNTCCPF